MDILKILMPRLRNGFTVVELAITVTMIVILASISIVTYNHVQLRARDNQRVSDMKTIKDAFELWGARTGKRFDESQAGSGGATLGWFDGAYGSTQSARDLLWKGGYTSTPIKDPIDKKTGMPYYSYMISYCDGSHNSRVILARLERPPSKTVNQILGSDDGDINDTDCTHSSFTNYTSAYGMNYGLLIEL